MWIIHTRLRTACTTVSSLNYTQLSDMRQGAEHFVKWKGMSVYLRCRTQARILECGAKEVRNEPIWIERIEMRLEACEAGRSLV